MDDLHLLSDSIANFTKESRETRLSCRHRRVGICYCLPAVIGERSVYRISEYVNLQLIIRVDLNLAYTIDEEVVLIHVYLHARCTSVEIEQCLRTVLCVLRFSMVLHIEPNGYTDVHHLGITPSIRSVE